MASTPKQKSELERELERVAWRIEARIEGFYCPTWTFGIIDRIGQDGKVFVKPVRHSAVAFPSQPGHVTNRYIPQWNNMKTSRDWGWVSGSIVEIFDPEFAYTITF